MGGSTHAPSSTVLGRLADLKKEIETQNLIKDVLEARANVAEKKIHELNLKPRKSSKKKKLAMNRRLEFVKLNIF